jgi:hypothetical protein
MSFLFKYTVCTLVSFHHFVRLDPIYLSSDNLVARVILPSLAGGFPGVLLQGDGAS